jgi:predicted small lipoprotein YifL
VGRVTLLRIAACAAMAVVLALTGCGRKSGLDPPPGSSYAQPEPAAQPGVPEELGPDGKPLPPTKPGLKRWTPIDWLID